MRSFKIRVRLPDVAPYSYPCLAPSSVDALMSAVNLFGLGARISVRPA